MDDRLLSKIQKNDVIDLIRSKDIDPLLFKFTEEQFRHFEITGRPLGDYRCHVLRVTDSYFKFNNNGKTYYLEFSPGAQGTCEHQTARSWSTVLNILGYWLDRMKKEIEAPDLWSELNNFQENRINSEYGENAEIQFSEDEKQIVRLELKKIEQKLLETHSLVEDQIEYIKTRFDNLDKKLEAMDKDTWRTFFLGTLVNLAFYLSPTLGSQIMTFIGNAYGQLISAAFPVVQKLLN